MTPEFKVAGIRGAASSVVTGMLAFFAVWSQTDDPKTLIIAFSVPFLTTISLRFGLEGAIDSKKA